MTYYRIRAEEKMWLNSNITLDKEEGLKQEEVCRDLAGWADDNNFKLQKVAEDGEVLEDELYHCSTIKRAEYILTALEHNQITEKQLLEQGFTTEELENKLGELANQKRTEVTA